MEVRQKIEIRRPPEVVFDFLTDTASFPIIDRALVSHTPDGRMHVGLEGTFVHRRGGMKVRSTWAVVELERPTRVRVAVRGMGYELHETATLERLRIWDPRGLRRRRPSDRDRREPDGRPVVGDHPARSRPARWTAPLGTRTARWRRGAGFG
jgi:Polyketide cyclase / dehydrase and lipid transport